MLTNEKYPEFHVWLSYQLISLLTDSSSYLKPDIDMDQYCVMVVFLGLLRSLLRKSNKMVVLKIYVVYILLQIIRKMQTEKL